MSPVTVCANSAAQVGDRRHRRIDRGLELQQPVKVAIEREMLARHGVGTVPMDVPKHRAGRVTRDQPARPIVCRCATVDQFAHQMLNVARDGSARREFGA